MIDALGWMATAVFVGSYFFTRPGRLRAAQVAGAGLWMVYGVMIGALPVIVANVLVAAAACWTAIRSRRASSSAAGTGAGAA